jgi:hypothetical protein
MAASTQADLLGNRYGHLAYRRRVIVYSTVSTATYNVSPNESGALFYVANVSTAKFSLPKVSSLAKGLTYSFHIAQQTDVLDVNIVSTIDSSAHIVGIHGTTGTTISTNSAISPASTINFSNFVTVTAISSVVWVAEPEYSVESSGADVVGALIFGGWTSGTTAA